MSQEVMKKYTEIFARGKIQDYRFIEDPQKILSTKDIELLWVYFRSTDPIILEKFPDVSQLQERFSQITPEYIKTYQKIYDQLKALWYDFIKYPKSYVEFLGIFPDDKMVAISKEGETFTILFLLGIHEKSYQFVQKMTDLARQRYGLSDHLIIEILNIYDDDDKTS